jgi:tetratricopeptide (TPR) repeat protein
LTRCIFTHSLLAALVGLLLFGTTGCSGPESDVATSSLDGEQPPPTGPLTILYPPDQALFPPDIVAPTFRWEDPHSPSDTWQIRFAFQDGPDLDFRSSSTEWTPADDSWQAIVERGLSGTVEVTILGVNKRAPNRSASEGSLSIGISEDAVEAPIFFREVNLPFLTAVKDPAAHIRWRFGSIASKEPPPIVLDKLLVCGNCHSFSADGSTLAMEIDSGNDKGSYAIVPVEKEIALDDSKIITWSDYRKEDGETTFGLLCQISPDGRYVAGTVKDRAVAVYQPDLMYSQLFFLVKGIVAIHDRQTDTIFPLPGADDRRFVQTNATWSPDGQSLVFARAEAYEPEGVADIKSVLVPREAAKDFLDGTREFKYDLFRIPFNAGKGGKPEPIEGASNNGMSNYFPKFSPDGKWIVFCKAKNFMLLQPDSELYIMPTSGGEARRLQCNTSRMNSWHSWAPNGKWLVFSSKEYSPYTQLFLTHIDEKGQSSVPVVLSRFTAPERAANIPEFVNAEPDAIHRLSADFLDDESYLRAAVAFIDQDDIAGAKPLLEKSLEINPDNVLTHRKMVDVLWNEGKFREVEAHIRRLLELEPDDAEAHFRLSATLREQSRIPEAVEQARRAIQIEADFFEARLSLGLLLRQTGELEESTQHFAEAVRLQPENAFANLSCGSAFHRLGNPEKALGYYEQAVQADAGLLPALLGIASLRIMIDHPELFDVDKALAAAEKACEVTHHEHPDALRVLAGVYAVSGQFDKAIDTASKAVRIARAGGATDLANRIQRMLEAYQQLRAERNRAPD